MNGLLVKGKTSRSTKVYHSQHEPCDQGQNVVVIVISFHEPWTTHHPRFNMKKFMLIRETTGQQEYGELLCLSQCSPMMHDEENATSTQD